MAGNYAQLLDIINNPTNHSLPAWDNDAKQIEGLTIKQYLLTIIQSLTAGYQFMGVATPSTNPGTPDQNVFYIGGAGTYANFGTSITVRQGQICIFKWNGSWTNTPIEIAYPGLLNINAYYNKSDGYTSKAAARSAVPSMLQKGGMILVYKYDDIWITEQCIDESDWLNDLSWTKYNVDSTPTLNSKNLVQSGGVKAVLDSIQTELDNTQNLIENEYQKERLTTNYTELIPIIDMGAGLYAWYDMIVVYTDNPVYKYSKYDVSNISRIKVKGRTYGQDFSLISFVDENEQEITHLYDIVNEAELDVPTTAKYAYVNGGSASEYNIEGYSVTPSYESIIPELDDLEDRVSAIENLQIVCTGDSVTEGMNMDGGGYAQYGKAPYPAQLYTMLVDGGYERYKVVNQGQGGETTPTMVARTGAMACIILNDINLPNNTSWVDLGNTTSIAKCNLKIPIKMLDNSTDYPVYFTQTKEVTTPVFIDGNYYNLRTFSLNGQIYMQIQKTDISNTATKIPAGSMLLTNSTKNPYLGIVFGGHNGRTELDFARWAAMMESCLATTAGKGFVIGSHIAIWATWSDLTGADADTKYIDYKNKATEKFGIRFIDLYDLWFRHALEYCLAAGYFSDKTQLELDDMADKLSDHIVPAEFSYDGAHEGDVHLNREGYYVIAKLLYDRLIAIHYIS